MLNIFITITFIKTIDLYPIAEASGFTATVGKFNFNYKYIQFIDNIK